MAVVGGAWGSWWRRWRRQGQWGAGGEAEAICRRRGVHIYGETQGKSDARW